MGYDGLETDAEMLRDYALTDAKEALCGEQVAYWHFGDPRTGKCPEGEPRREDLANWLDCEPSQREWRIYSQAFNAAIKAGVKVCEAVDFDTWGEDGDEEADTIAEACNAAEQAVGKLS